MTSPRHVSASTAHDLTVPHLGFLIVNLKTPGWKREPSSDCTGSDTCNTSGSASGLGTSMSAINMVAWKWRSITERTYCSGFMAVPLAAICRHDDRTAASVATYASKSQNFHVTSTSTANPKSMKGMVTVRAKQNGRNRILRLSCPIGVEPNHAFDPLTSIWSKCSCLAWLRTHWNKSLMGQILGVLKAATQKPCEWSSLTTTISSPEDSSLGLISKKNGMPVITVRVPTVVGTRFGQSSLLSSGMSVGSSWKHCQVGETQNRFSCDSSCASISSSLESTTVVGTGLGTQTFGWSDMKFPLRMTENSSRLHLVDMTFMQSSWTLRRSPGKPETSPKRTLARRHCRAACGTDKALPTKCHASRYESGRLISDGNPMAAAISNGVAKRRHPLTSKRNEYNPLSANRSSGSSCWQPWAAMTFGKGWRVSLMRSFRTSCPGISRYPFLRMFKGRYFGSAKIMSVSAFGTHWQTSQSCKSCWTDWKRPIELFSPMPGITFGRQIDWAMESLASV